MHGDRQVYDAHDDGSCADSTGCRHQPKIDLLLYTLPKICGCNGCSEDIYAFLNDCVKGFMQNEETRDMDKTQRVEHVVELVKANPEVAGEFIADILWANLNY